MALGYTVLWKTTSLFYVIFFKIKGKEISSIPFFFGFIQLLCRSRKNTTKPNPFGQNCRKIIRTRSSIVRHPLFIFLCVWPRRTSGQSVEYCTCSAHPRSAWKAQERLCILYVYTLPVDYVFFFSFHLLCTFLSITFIVIRVWLGWNIQTYRSWDGYCCHFCDAGSTLPGRRTFPGVWRMRADSVFQSRERLNEHR